MKVEANALVLLKKGPIFSIATFFRKLFFGQKKEVFEKVEMTEEERLMEYQKGLEECKITTSSLRLEQIKALEKLYQKQIEEIERQIKLLEARNHMCEFKIQMYEKEKSTMKNA